MIADWLRQEHQLGELTTQAQVYLTTFIALIGVAFARRGQKTVSDAAWECEKIRNKLELP